MSENKQTVELYIEGFNEGNDAKILSCLTEDVAWYMPGFIDIKGKTAFAGEIHNDAFTGKPGITISRMSEENNVVIAEGAVKASFKDGNQLDAVFCDVFEMENGKIKKLYTYQMNR
ncbi:nuclear transport factor 2 family protein [Chitinophaga sp. GCM10012297]|uniref:Nuclear transport factor 2 family protein n=1 Tax=Chitinophaga chungangae TaxID=2821488 RepID=A0ABS3YBS7_9BACT|nr:nuclear transport factor 2 family protein [Chitinophaga chungangae]MBO9152116.1 nuclear transport factor 2 family protein [Chitinophaga chungangae]